MMPTKVLKNFRIILKCINFCKVGNTADCSKKKSLKSTTPPKKIENAEWRLWQ